MDFYDRAGRARMHTDNSGNLYRWDGTPVGFTRGDAVYNYAGQVIARLHDGWMRDRRGNALLFGDNPSGGPIPPIRQIPPIKSMPRIPRIPPNPAKPPLPAIPTFSWSAVDIDDLI